MDNKVNKNKVLYDYSGVPPDAKEQGLFCLYRIEAKSRDAPKQDKIPYTRYGNRADSGNRSDFVHLPIFMRYTSRADMTVSVWATSSTAWWMWMTAFKMESSTSEGGTSLRP